MTLVDQSTSGTRWLSATAQRGPGLCLVVVLMLTTLGEGGASATALAAWHFALVLLVVWAVLRPDPLAAQIEGLPRVTGFALLAIAAIGVVRAPYAFGAWLWWVELIASCSVAVLAARRGPPLLGTLATWLPWAALVQIAYVIVQRSLHDDPRPGGTFLNPNHLAAWLVAVALLTAGTAAHEPRPRRRVVGGLLVLIALGGVVLTGSRGALLGLAAGGTAFGLMSWPRLGRQGRLALAGSAGIAMLAGGVVLVSRFDEADPFRWHRARIWSASAQVGIGAPWTGSGPGQFAARSDRLQFDDGTPPLAYERRFSTPHSDLLRVWAELGLPGTAALLGLIVATGVTIAVRRRRGELPLAADGAVAALWALLAHGSVEDLTERPAVYLLAAALVGSLLGRPSALSPPRMGPGLRGTLALLLFVAYFVGDLGPTRSWLEMARLPRGSLRSEEWRRLDRALTMNPLHPDGWLRQAEGLVADRENWSIESYARARESAEHAVRLHPDGVAYVRGVARVEAQGCRELWPTDAMRTRAAAWYARAAELAPTDPSIPLELGAFLLDLGDPAGAELAGERALSIEPEAVAPRLLVAAALLERQEPQIDRAARLVDDASRQAAHYSAHVAELESRRAPETRYARALLQADPSQLAKVQRVLAAARAAAADPATSVP